MATEKRRPNQKPSLKFQAKAALDQTQERINVSSMADDLRKSLSGNLDKSVKPQTVKRELKGKYDQTKVVFSSREFSQQIDNVETKGWRRVSDPEQRELAQIDPYISSIIANRCSQGAVIGYESDSKFDKGTRVLDLAAPEREDFETEQEYHRECAIHEAHQRAILKWVINCGTTNRDVVNAAFAGGDLTFKWCTLREFLESQIRNLLTFGRCATQIFRNEDGVPVMFRPVPVETIFNVIEGKMVHLGHREETAEQSEEDLKEYAGLEEDERPIAYVQRIDNQNVNFFTEDDLHVWHWQKQALFDLNGYPLSPIEQAIYMVYIHQQTLGYLRNQFVKGMGNKGLITMEATQPGVEISDADMEDFRQQFHNFVTRNDNSAVVPVIGGPVKVNYISLSSTPRDMEFLQVEEHVVRALCSAFQISPQEMGYGHLSIGQGGLTQINKQEDIIKGEERGLRMLLDIIYDGLNYIVYENFPDAQDQYRVSYVGVGEDTREAVTERQQMELNTTATMSSLFADSEKSENVPFGGDVPLAPLFHANVAKYMKLSEMRYHFFKEKDALKNPAYDFFIDPVINEAYQSLKIQPLQMQQASAGLGFEQQKMEVEQGQMMLEQAAQQPPPGAEEQQEPPPEDQQPPEGEEVEKSLSLRDKWLERRKLQKSMRLYFSSYLDANDEIN